MDALSGIPTHVDLLTATNCSLDVSTKPWELHRVTRVEYLYILRHGFHEKAKGKFDLAYDAWNYAIRGKTVDRRNLRVIVSFDEENMLIITVIEVMVDKEVQHFGRPRIVDDPQTFTFYVDRGYVLALDRLARDAGISRSALLREIVEAYLMRYGYDGLFPAKADR